MNSTKDLPFLSTLFLLKVFILNLCYIASISASQQKQTPIKIVYPHVPPYAYNPALNPHPDKPGILVEAYQAVLDRMGVTYTLQFLPYRRIYRYFDNGRADMAVMDPSGISLIKKPLLCSRPIHSTTISLYWSDNAPFPPGEEDWNNTALVSTGLNMEDLTPFLPKNIRLEPARPELLPELLNTKRKEWVIDLSIRMDTLLAAGNTREIHSTPLTTLNLYLCSAKGGAASKTVLERTALFIQNLHCSPEGRAIYERYSVTLPACKTTP